MQKGIEYFRNGHEFSLFHRLIPGKYTTMIDFHDIMDIEFNLQPLKSLFQSE
jgi:hypothetical protein